MIGTASRLLSLATHIRAIEDTFNANDLFVLAYVHQNEGCTVDDLVTALETLAPSSASRICARLGDHSRQVVGHGFLTLEVDATDARKRRIYMTTKGRGFLNHLGSDLDGMAPWKCSLSPTCAA